MKEDKLLPLCGAAETHAPIIERVREAMPNSECLYALSELFKVFGDGTRIRILCALTEAELCVCDIATLINMSVSAVSHQLRVLKQAKLIKYRKSGKTVFYSLADDHVRTVIENGMEHVNE